MWNQTFDDLCDDSTDTCKNGCPELFLPLELPNCCSELIAHVLCQGIQLAGIVQSDHSHLCENWLRLRQTFWIFFQKTWSSLSKEVVTREEQERWASFLNLCVALPSCSTAPFISLQKLLSCQYLPSIIWSTLYCKCVRLWPCEALVSSLIPVCTVPCYLFVCTSGLVSFLIPVCTGPESAFQIKAWHCALTAASQADANVNSLQQMPLGNPSMSVAKLKWLDCTFKENTRHHLVREDCLCITLCLVVGSHKFLEGIQSVQTFVL